MSMPEASQQNTIHALASALGPFFELHAQAGIWHVLEQALQAQEMIEPASSTQLKRLNSLFKDWEVQKSKDEFIGLARSHGVLNTASLSDHRLGLLADSLIAPAYFSAQTVLREFLSQQLARKARRGSVSHQLGGAFFPDPLDSDDQSGNRHRWLSEGVGFAEDVASRFTRDKGCFSNADTLLWFAPKKERRAYKIVVIDYTLNAPPLPLDTSSEATEWIDQQREALAKQAYAEGSREIVSMLKASSSAIDGEGNIIAMRQKMHQYLHLARQGDKSVNKMIQAIGYGCDFARVLRDQEGLEGRKVEIHAIGMSTYGVDYLKGEGEFGALDEPEPIRWAPNIHSQLMSAMQSVYKTHEKPRDEHWQERATGTLESLINKVLRRMRKGASPEAREHIQEVGQALRQARENPPQSQSMRIPFVSESLDPPNPNDRLNRAPVLDAQCDAFFGGGATSLEGSAKQAYEQRLDELRTHGGLVREEIDNEPTYRDAHAALIESATRTALSGGWQASHPPIIGLLAHPGAGKTFAARRAMPEKGTIFIYAAPRLNVLDDAMKPPPWARHSGSEVEGETGRTLYLSTSSKLLNADLAGAYRDRVQADPGYTSLRHGLPWIDQPEGAVTMSGIGPEAFRHPTPEQGNQIVFIPHADAQELQEQEGRKCFRKRTYSDQSSQIEAHQASSGVMSTLMRAARIAIDTNPQIESVVLCLSIQSFKNIRIERGSDDNGIGSCRHLDHLFIDDVRRSNDRDDQHRRARKGLERLRHELGFSCLCVMVDEITGDGGGLPFSEAIYKWLQSRFYDPYEERATSAPVQPLLYIADASLPSYPDFQGYMNRYAELRAFGAQQVPAKTMISQGHANQPIRAFYEPIPIRRPAALNMPGGQGKSNPSALFIEMDAYPASRDERTPDQSALTIHMEAESRIYLPSEEDEQSIYQRYQQEMIEFIACRVLRSLHYIERYRPEPEQVLVFVQNKQVVHQLQVLLKQVSQGRAPEEIERVLEGTGLDAEEISRLLEPDQVHVLHSKVGKQEREEAAKAVSADQARVILMTSSGSRGLSFPLATEFICVPSTQSPPSEIMEVNQFLFRGRGTRTLDDAAQTRIEGDHRPRRIHINPFYARFIQQSQMAREWRMRDRFRVVQEQVDFISYCFFVRASILTRIQGNGGLSAQEHGDDTTPLFSVTPVGGIGVSEINELHAQKVLQSRKEILDAIRFGRIPNPETSDELHVLMKQVQKQLRHYKLYRKHEHDDGKPAMWSEAGRIRSKNNLVTAPNRRVFRGAPILLPANLFAKGYVMYQREASDRESRVAFEEHFFPTQSPQVGQDESSTENYPRNICRICRRLLADSSSERPQERLPVEVRQSLDAIQAIFDHTDTYEQETQRVRAPDQEVPLYFVFPTNGGLISEDDEKLRKESRNQPICFQRGLDADNDDPEAVMDQWRGLLTSTCTDMQRDALAAPPVPAYEKSGVPWIALHTEANPSGYDLTFDDSYIGGGSKAFNLIGAMLLEAKDTLGPVVEPQDEAD